MSLEGLTSEQVALKTKQGKINRISSRNQTTIPKIILKNTLTIFNLVNLILAIMIILVGSYKNLLFVLIAIANTLISIINEIRAKKTVDKMRLLAEKPPTVIRDSKSQQIPSSEVVEGDLIIYGLGDQVVVDSQIKEGNVEVNEAYVTGEQKNISKKRGDQLISGSFIVSGTCKATVTAVGNDNFIGKLETDAHTIKTADSKLFTIMNNIVKYISFALIPIGALLLWARFRVESTTTEVAVTSTVAALINMIPEGLILLTSSVLALATIRLSRKKVLVQDLYSIETLARVDTICLDKTGTLTTGAMQVHDYTAAQKSFESTLEAILMSQTTENQTVTALKKKFVESAKKREIEPIEEIIDFSSDRKYSGIKTKSATYLLGAIDFITNDQNLIKQVKLSSEGYRTLAVVKKASSCQLLGYVRLEDEIRHDAPDIIKYFYDNEIAVKIISGDDLDSVKTIAKKVGIKELNGVNLAESERPNYDRLAKDYNIFTRVTPAQKKNLIKAFKKQGATVAMTGDGVNDILAMKESDVSLAIGAGSDAARRSAKIVLLNSDFAGVPSIIDEGRQSINNLERSTTLFLSKTVYASILAVLFTVLPFQYPYAPIEMSLLNFACIGLPGLVLALEHNTARIKNQFVTFIKRYSIPTGIIVSLSMLMLSIIAHYAGIPRPELILLSTIITFVIDFCLIYRISRPLNPFRATLLVVIILIMATAFLLPLARELLFY
ncbi:HAD-IC family P-type ATPase [Candidatus Saccharibacteria bacterium]|nr:HAD-IC family P-type ATPase [Candidatus Saccharibacteria bacterium]